MLEQLISGDYLAVLMSLFFKAAIILSSWVLIFSASLVDMWSGISAAKHLGRPLNSHGFRKTMTKVGDYFKVTLIALLFDIIGFLFSFYSLPFASLLIALAVILIEGKSVMENVEMKRNGKKELRETLKDIIDAVTEKDAKSILKKILKEKSIEGKNEKWYKQVNKKGRAG